MEGSRQCRMCSFASDSTSGAGCRGPSCLGFRTCRQDATLSVFRAFYKARHDLSEYEGPRATDGSEGAEGVVALGVRTVELLACVQEVQPQASDFLSAPCGLRLKLARQASISPSILGLRLAARAVRCDAGLLEHEFHHVAASPRVRGSEGGSWARS